MGTRITSQFYITYMNRRKIYHCYVYVCSNGQLYVTPTTN